MKTLTVKVDWDPDVPNDFIADGGTVTINVTPELAAKVHEIYQAVMADPSTVFKEIPFKSDGVFDSTVDLESLVLTVGGDLTGGFWDFEWVEDNGITYWTEPLPIESLDDVPDMDLSFILETLKCAKDDIEDLIEIAGTDPRDVDSMLEDNYTSQWATLRDLETAIEQVEGYLKGEH